MTVHIRELFSHSELKTNVFSWEEKTLDPAAVNKDFVMPVAQTMERIYWLGGFLR